MNIKNLYVVWMNTDKMEKFKVEACRENHETGHNEVFITVYGKAMWIDAYDAVLYRDQGSVFCWKDYNEGMYIELNESNPVCPICGWWKCNYCGSCDCNKS